MSEEATPKTISVTRFVDVVINGYTDYEPLRKIEVYFNSVKRCDRYNSWIITPELIHLEFSDDTPSMDFAKIIDHNVDNDYILSLNVSKSKSRPFDKLVNGSVYKLVIDTSQLKEFTANNGKNIKYYETILPLIDRSNIQSEFESYKRNISQ